VERRQVLTQLVQVQYYTHHTLYHTLYSNTILKHYLVQDEQLLLEGRGEQVRPLVLQLLAAYRAAIGTEPTKRDCSTEAATSAERNSTERNSAERKPSVVLGFAKAAAAAATKSGAATSSTKQPESRSTNEPESRSGAGDLICFKHQFLTHPLTQAAPQPCTDHLGASNAVSAVAAVAAGGSMAAEEPLDAEAGTVGRSSTHTSHLIH
jgi:hypothetical protein